MGQIVKKFSSILLLVCFTLTDLTPAFAQNNQSSIGLDPAMFSDIDPEKYTQDPTELTPEEAQEAKNILNKPTQSTLEIMFLLKNLNYRVQMEVEKQGADAIAKLLSKRKDSENIEFEVENVGKAEPLVINTERGPLFFTKVRHNSLKMSILFIDKNQVDIKLLEETERLEKQGLLHTDKTLQGLSAKEIKEELNYRKLILKNIRVLYARMLMSEWNPQLEYTPLSEIVDKTEQAEALSKAPEEVQEHIDAVLYQPIEQLKKESWFKRISSKTYDTWIDLAKQEKAAASVNAGNEELMIVYYDGSNGQIDSTDTIRKASKFSFEYWNTYWKAIWEKPAYGEPVWKKSKGLGKLKVLLTGDYLMGISFGIALGSLSFLVSTALPGSLPSGLDAYDVARVSFGWSLFFGVFSKTWQNFVYRGNDFVRFIKNWSTGLGQSYNFNLISNESLALIGTDGNFDANAIKIHTDIVVNQSIKTVTKTSLQETPRYRAKTGESEGTLKIKYYKAVLPWKHNMSFMQLDVVENSIDPLKLYRWVRDQFSIEKYEPKEWEEKLVLRFKKDLKITLPWLVPAEYETYVPRKNFEGQTPQLITTPVGLLSRFGFTVAGVPLGHILYAVLGPIGEIRQIRYKTRYADELAKKYGEEHALTRRVRKMVKIEIDTWSSLKIANIPGTQFIGYYTKVVPQQVYEAAKKLAAFLARKAAYSTYSMYEGVQKTFDNIEKDRKLSQSETQRMNLLMTVRTDKNQIHPQQIENGIHFYRTQLCSKLFQ